MCKKTSPTTVPLRRLTFRLLFTQGKLANSTVPHMYTGALSPRHPLSRQVKLKHSPLTLTVR
jgi:hypothetical protein